MLEWIAGYVARWTGYVEQNTRGLVQWGLHALAGVVYAVFGNVGKAWHVLLAALQWMHGEADSFAGWVVLHLTALVTVDLPKLWSYAVAGFRAAAQLASRLYHLALAAAAAAAQLARQLVKDAIGWVITHVYDPLLALAKQLRADLLKWGYAAWWLVTHPDKLAPILLGALIGAAESAFFTIAGPAGRFALRLIVSQLPRLLTLTEAIVKAVL